MKRNDAPIRGLLRLLIGLIGLYFILLAHFTSPWPLIVFGVLIGLLAGEEALVRWFEGRGGQAPLPLDRSRQRKPGALIDSDGELPEKPDAALESADEPLSLDALLKGKAEAKPKRRAAPHSR